LRPAGSMQNPGPWSYGLLCLLQTQQPTLMDEPNNYARTKKARKGSDETQKGSRKEESKKKRKKNEKNANERKDEAVRLCWAKFKQALLHSL